jgi:hypothetical protein
MDSMKNKFLILMLFSGLQIIAIDQEIIQASSACCFVVACEATRMFVREADQANQPYNIKFKLKDSGRKPFTCCNVCTIGAIGCCLAGNPQIGAASSLLGCCIDFTHYKSTMDKNLKSEIKKF